MAVTGKKVLRMTASLDVFDSGLKKLKLKGCRLVTAAADSTAVVRSDDANGEVLYSLSALAKTSDDTAIETIVESGKLHLTLSGAGAEVFVYLE